MSIEAKPVYFESGQGSLFGWLHLPPKELSCGLGIVICKPFGYESICAHTSIRAFADACAATGATVLRFDYAGTGDSNGSESSQDEIGLWCADIRAAMQALRRHAQVTQVGLLGLRFGALLAGMVAAEDPEVALTMLVAPVVNGRRYLRELRAFQVASSSEFLKATDSPAQAEEGFEVTGFRFSQPTVDRLGQIDMSKLGGRAVAETLIVDRHDLPAAKGLADMQLAQGSRVNYQVLPGLLEMIAAPQAAHIPQEMVAAVREYLNDYRHRHFLPQGTAVQTQQWAAELRLTAENGSRLVERPVYVDEAGTLFAITTEQAAEAGSRPARFRHGVIMLNGGATSHIGPNRMYVELARRWAARGYCVLRLDLAGLGDSGTRPGRSDNEVYPPGALDDVSAAVNYLRKEYGVEVVTLAGLCAGAYHALRSAISGLQVDTVLLINPLTFYWKQGSKLSDLQEFEVVRNPGIYAERVLSGKSWRKVLRGRVNLWRVAMIILRRPMLTVGSTVRDLTRRLRIRLPQDLGWELQAAASRGVRIVFLFARKDAGRDLLRLQGGSAIKSLGERCRVHVIDGADHVFSQGAARRELLQLLTSELPQL